MHKTAPSSLHMMVTTEVRDVKAEFISILANEDPLGRQLERARARLAAAPEAEHVEAALESAILATLLGRPAEAEGPLAFARRVVPPEARRHLELGCALVMLEAGYPARMAGALERAEASPASAEGPATQALTQSLHAQLLLLNGTTAAAARAAVEGLATLPPEAEASLAVYVHLAAVECLLATGALTDAAAYLAKTDDMPGRTGLLTARAAAAQARLCLAMGEHGPEARAMIEQAILRLGWLGAPRDLALAYVVRAHLATAVGTDTPAHWLAQAQPLLTQVGTAGDLRQLHQAIRSCGRRKVDRLVKDAVEVIEALRERHARLRDILLAQRDARGPGQRPAPWLPSPLAKAADDSLESMRLVEEELIGALERTALDRERMNVLVAVCQELASIDGWEEVVGAVPRLALVFIPKASAALLEVDEAGAFTCLSGDSSVASLPPEGLAEAVVAAVGEGVLQLIPGEAGVVLPLRSAGDQVVLVLRWSAETAFDVHELEQLTVFGSLAGNALARARAGAALRQAAARDAATLAAIRDGVVTLAEDGTVCTLNHAAEHLLRATAEQLLGRRLQDFTRLAPLGEALSSGRQLAGEVVALAHGDLLVRSQTYEGGVVATLQELAMVQRLAHKLVGSQARFTFEDLVGRAPAFLACLEDARRAARSDVPIVITGESGTGKELLAQAIHCASSTAALPFVGINVAAFPRELLESELFGYERGAFTGARAGGNPGKLELADRGTLLLDEIGDMPLEMQVKLLRVLQERLFQRLGSRRDILLQARVIATTHRDLERAVAEGSFRLDLFYRLRVIHLRLPALRERQGDIPLLVEHHLRRHAARRGRRPLRVAPRVMEAFEAYDWPGNVRELANVLEGAASLLPEDENALNRIPSTIERALQCPRSASPRAAVVPFDEVERQAFAHALEHCAGNVARAAKALGVAKATFYSKIRRYGLTLAAAG